MTIYEIDDRIRECEGALMDAVDEETGEITDEELAQRLNKELAALDVARERKIEGACLLRREALASAEAIAAEIQRLTRMKKHEENRANGLKRYVTNALCGEKFKTPMASVYYQRSESVDVLNVDMLPPAYVKIKKEPDKAEIKRAIKGGHEVYGASLVEHMNTIIK